MVSVARSAKTIQLSSPPVFHPPPEMGWRGSGGCHVQAKEVPEADHAYWGSANVRRVSDALPVPSGLTAHDSPD
eukprot:11462488-Alexandrium_andersonii.AAC.1